MIFNKPSKFMFKIIVYFGLTLFSLFVLYDTNQMLLNYNKNSDVLDSTMNFYLDIINIFSNLFALEE
jgi:FtsH-binding integral membrane protein